MEIYQKPGGVNCGDYSCPQCYGRRDGGLRASVPLAAPTQARIWLNVPYREKESAKAAGARWDAAYKRWYAPNKEIEAACKQWALPVVTMPTPRGVQQSLTLSRGPRPAPVQAPLVAPVKITTAKPAAPVRKARTPVVVAVEQSAAEKPGSVPYEDFMAAIRAAEKPEQVREYVQISNAPRERLA